ncbi:MAG: 2-oxoglutarate carboxylase small subunit [Alphaproteobacteria bacterium MarineAlpha5_Bin5]|nr:MAG: 2-oxoglutarate carboxylase small subunit [Alphaproteobacteria bacterium MarineAlpha5_Bin5]PPR52747.1 MAG: 2-oxoglutarate carboxylase small subunit [Alphaproteobacteria bacterium MarineAlpha5_Bin4]
MKKIKKILAANRSEIAIRIFRAAEESGIRTAAIYSKEDRFALHRFKTDESYLVGKGKGPIQAYLDIESIIEIAKDAKVDAIHPGYGFLSENPEFANLCEQNDIIFIGPKKEILKKLGNKTEAKKVAKDAKVNIIPSVLVSNDNKHNLESKVNKIGYPVIVKASWGGGGRGMRVVYSSNELIDQINVAQRESKKAFGKDEVFIEKFLEDAAHIEVQILGDQYGNIIHLFERDCSLQRRHQKIIERAPAHFLNDKLRTNICESAIKIAKQVNYVGAGTVEFLLDKKTSEYYFIEVNPRIQVEHTVTEEVTGIDIVKAQIKIAEGEKIGKHTALPNQNNVRLDGFAIQCRVTTEDPQNNFMPDYGKIITYRSASGFGVRLDGATAAAGSIITPYYDSLLVKVTTRAQSQEDCIKRMDRALREFRIRGVKTNLVFLESLINNIHFKEGNYNTNFVDNNKDLYNFKPKKDRASKIISYLGNMIVNGHPDMLNRNNNISLVEPVIPNCKINANKNNYVSLLKEIGTEKFIQEIKNKNYTLVTDTTMRDAHQSLLATRMRSEDIINIAEFYSNNLSELFSLECWGGATFDTSMRFLKEDPWERLAKLNERSPNLLKQMLLRGSNAVGYKNYPDNVVKFFIKEAAESGIDVFRVFDSLNLIDNMKVSIDEIRSQNKICEGTICYTNDVTDPKEKKYTLNYYINLVKELERAGANIIAIKDMAGLCKPKAARTLIKEIKNNTNLPIHFHTHDTSGTSSATVLAAIEEKVDIVDLAMDSMSGLTSQPALGSIVSIMKQNHENPKLNENHIRSASLYWEQVRQNYKSFETDFKGGSSDVYLHQMPGGQFTNLKEQARSIGISTDKWGLIANKYAEVNLLFGDIIKVTPSSKVVGDMVLYMVTNDLTAEDVTNPTKEISFPTSVIEFFKGEMGIPIGGFPEKLQKKILGKQKPLKERAGSILTPINLEGEKQKLEKKYDEKIDNKQLASHLMYSKVFDDFIMHRKQFGDTSILSTDLFFYGPQQDKEYSIPIDKGKNLIIRYLAKSNPNANGVCSVFFELNGQPRTIDIQDSAFSKIIAKKIKSEDDNINQVGSPLPGQIAKIYIKQGDKVIKGDNLLVIEAMKMETTITAEKSGTIKKIYVSSGENIESKDLLIEID